MAYRRASSLLVVFVLLAGCTAPGQTPLQPLPDPAGNTAATPRVAGNVGTPPAAPSPMISYGRGEPVAAAAAGIAGSDEYALDFADADVRDAVAQVLGGMLNLTYTIDPAVRGTVTLHTARPLTRAQLLPTLQSLLAGVGAAVVQAEGVARVVPLATVGAGDSTVVALRYAVAEELVKVLQPLAGTTARLSAEPSRNAVVIAAPAGQAEPLVDLVRSFDVDELAGQSYAVLPVSSGNARDFADALRESLRSRAATAPVRTVPLPRFDAVLVIAPQPRYLDTVRRVYTLLEQERRRTLRSWHIHYLQNSHADDVAYTLQMAFTPGNVTALPTAQTGVGQRRMGSASGTSSAGSGGIGGTANGLGRGSTGGIGTGNGTGGLSALGTNGTPGGTDNRSATATATATTAASTVNPLLGGLDQGTASENPDAMRILSNPQNNAILVYATSQEEETVLAMLRKIDILPLQVRIDATIAEVTLNDQLKYGTQWFFKSGGINGVLNLPTSTTAVGNLADTALSTSFPGLVIGGTQKGGGPFALSALQAVTTVKVLSSPQIVVVDNQPARLQVGAMVPYLTAQSQSTLTSTATLVNSVSYQATGVILEVTPRVNSGGLVTLDIAQEVSDVDTTTPRASGIDSPQFQQRSVTSRVVVQDNQTIGLAGLIRDTTGSGNTGIPWLKDVPLLGLLAGEQNNQRNRTELLVLITPHVIHDQRDARALTEDMRQELRNAAVTPAELQALPASGSDDPGRKLRDRVRRWIER
ncbi:Type II secretion system protein GspD [Rhodovastum atsumiense]|uniref:Type II secretion system protein GspD n=1 Tax=Rhodovastum atsumiense TaxID=504468 RepID=A0A5M6IMD2_9PROT|nr:type II secretion system secretin GspD [Rhodovastum atsumiense]KAA5609402.1 type II secretion system protein GspD [Rhodovastum atsumiense]CAH2601841.1 Type II secretion system protein GspD [Rhodovastum atsumiense]